MRVYNKILLFLWFILICLVIYLLESAWIISRSTTWKVTKYLPFYSWNATNQPSFSNISSSYFRYTADKTTIGVSTEQRTGRNSVDVVLAVVACKDRLHETLVMIKSAIFFSDNVQLKVIVFADIPLIKGFEEKLSLWKGMVNNSFTYKVHPVSFPDNGKYEWQKLFKPCAAQRLFLPSLLKDVDSLLYVDTDTLFLGPIEDVWFHFSQMNSTQMAALAPEHEDPNTGWYNRFARHPYYGELGVNSGVMLMNLTRMREFGWEKYLAPIYKQFKLKIIWGDQDIINIIFHYHPERLYIYSCRYNYRSDHCMYMSVCTDANKRGVAVIHGSRGTFHGNKQPAFKAIFSSMEEYQLGLDPYQHLLLPLEQALEQTVETNCGKVRESLTANIQKYISVKNPLR